MKNIPDTHGRMTLSPGASPADRVEEFNSLMIMGITLTPGRIVLLYAVFVVLWIASSDWLMTLVVRNPSVLPHISSAKGIIFVVVTAGLMYLLYRRQSASDIEAHETSVRGYRLPPVKRNHLLAGFIALVAAVPVIDYVIVQQQGERFEQEGYRDLEVISEFKAREVERWLTERQGDAAALSAGQSLARQVNEFFNTDSESLRDSVHGRLDGLRVSGDYAGVMLLDAQHRPVFTLGHYVELTPHLRDLLATAQQEREIMRSALYRDRHGHIHLDWVVPIVLDDDSGGRVVAQVVLHVDPERALFPRIQSWPMASDSAEVLLVRREGSEVVFLNSLRNRQVKPMEIRFPLHLDDLPAAMAAASGRPGVMPGIDYRGSPVLSAWRPIEGTDWHLVAKIDHDEVLAPLREQIFWITAITIAAILMVIATLMLMQWRISLGARQYGEQVEAEKGRLLRNIYDLPFIGIAVTAPGACRPIQVNDQLCMMLGYSREELLALEWQTLLHGDEHAPGGVDSQRMLSGEIDGYQRDTQVVCKDGTTLDTIFNVQCVREPNGGIEYYLATIQDISERKAAEQALREREQRLSYVMAATEEGLWDWDLVANRVMHNAHWCRLLGLEDQFLEHPVEDFIDLIHADDREVVMTRVQDCLDGKGPYRSEHRMVRRDGSFIWVMDRGEVVERDEDGNARRMVGSFADITEAKFNEAHLRQAAAVFESSREGIIVTDAGHRIRMVNRAFCDMVGYCEEELLGQSPTLFESGHKDRDLHDAMWQDLEANGYWQGEVWDRRKNGEVFPALLSINAVDDLSGELSGYVAIYTDISRIKASEAQLEFLAHHDSLTGLPNRLLMLSRLEHSVEVARRDGSRLALLMLDLDRFKDVNDSFGHLAGDELLQQVAARLTHRLRGIDTITRLGGDEFTLLLEDLPHPEDAVRVANEVIELLSQPWQLSNGAEVRIGVSIGISLYPEHGDSAEMLLQHVDAALYQAKAEGRGSVRYYSDDLTRAARGRIELESRLRRAIAEKELRVFYQPQLDVRSGHIIGAEALVRWEDPERGLISPLEFIPVAEETGLISEIGAWVLEETCRQGRAWRDAGLPPLTLAVNLSPHQFRHSDIGATVAQALETTGFPAGYLELELTESVLMAREEEAVAVLKRLRAQGVRLAIDDFGTGYSSLAYLKRFPLDLLKIDKSFIRDIPRDRDDREIATAIIAMAHALGFKVLAEGVETEAQLQFLRAEGCDYYQGFHVSTALPASGFAALFMAAGDSRTG